MIALLRWDASQENWFCLNNERKSKGTPKIFFKTKRLSSKSYDQHFKPKGMRLDDLNVPTKQKYF